MTYSLTANTQPGQRLGRIDVVGTGYYFHISQNGTAPTPTLTSWVEPSAGAGPGQVFKFSYQSLFGVNDFLWFDMQFRPDGTYPLGQIDVRAGSCATALSKSWNLHYLFDDAGGLIGSAASGLPGTPLESNLCFLNPGSSTGQMASANVWEVNQDVRFRPALQGTPSIYMGDQRTSALGSFSGWIRRGSYNVVPSANVVPTPVSVTPNNLTGSSATFTLKYSDSNGVTDIKKTAVLINSVFNAASACYVEFDRIAFSNAGSLALSRDDGTMQPAVRLGGGGVISNSQCSVDTNQSSRTITGTDLDLVLKINFQPGFQGSRAIYRLATDFSNANSGWQTRGAWTVPDTTPLAITNVRVPSIGSTSVAVAWDTNEAADTEVECKLAAPTYAVCSALNTVLVNGHSAVLSGLTPDTAYSYRVKSKDAAGNLATAESSFTTAAAQQPQNSVRGDSGGVAAHTDPQGRVWAADYGCTGGTTAAAPGPNSLELSGSTSPDVCQTARYAGANESFTCTYAVPNGNYRVTLKFAEIQMYFAGQRSTSLAINGTALPSIDVAAAANHRVAVDRTYVVGVTGGQIQIVFSGQSPQVSGIEIVPASEVEVTLTSAAPGPLTAGQTSQFQANTSAVTWSVSPAGRGTISTAGL